MNKQPKDSKVERYGIDLSTINTPPFSAASDTCLPRLLTTSEVAKMLRVSERTLEDWRTRERGPSYFRLGNAGRSKVLYELHQILAWLESNPIHSRR
jgi:hypothetical protein